jgi:hypothetical protein
MLAGELACDLGEAPAAVASYARALALARDDRERCLAQVGGASAHRLSSATKEGFAALDLAQPIAERLGLARELARIAYLRGSLHFARGELERCAAWHEQSLSHARDRGRRAMRGAGAVRHRRRDVRDRPAVPRRTRRSSAAWRCASGAETFVTR